MAQRQGGGRESTWQVARRCLALLRRVQQGVTDRAGLLTAVYASEGDEAYGGTTGAQLSKRFDEDKRRLWEELGVRIGYDKTVGGYVIEEWERPLLDLSDEHIQTLAFLADAFQPDSPRGNSVQALLETLLSWLEEDRRRVYERARGVGPELDLRLRDSEPIAADVWDIVQAAYERRQQIAFDYQSSSQADGIPRHHEVEPWYLYFSDRGHYLLRGYCLFNDGPNGSWRPHQYIPYRLSRIVPGSVTLLNKKLPSTPRTPKPYKVIYELAPAVARFGVSRRPELLGEPAIFPLDEGWVRVEGQTYDLFELARNLLYYGANCRVLGGVELRREMEKIVRDLAGVYHLLDR